LFIGFQPYFELSDLICFSLRYSVP